MFAKIIILAFAITLVVGVITTMALLKVSKKKIDAMKEDPDKLLSEEDWKAWDEQNKDEWKEEWKDEWNDWELWKKMKDQEQKEQSASKNMKDINPELELKISENNKSEDEK